MNFHFVETSRNERFSLQEVNLDVGAWRVVRLDVRGSRVVDLDVFWIWRGCVVRLDDI